MFAASKAQRCKNENDITWMTVTSVFDGRPKYSAIHQKIH